MTSYVTIGIIIAGIAASMGFATYMYNEYQPNFILVEAGQPVQIGPIIYTVEHLGMHEGDDDIKPNEIFFKINIMRFFLKSILLLKTLAQQLHYLVVDNFIF
jgi:hypothetical protein